MKKIFALVAALLLLVSCGEEERGYTAYDTFVKEYAPEEIEIAGPAAGRKAEISGLTYYNEHLIILPQYPDRVGDALYAIHISELESWLGGNGAKPIEPESIEFTAKGLERFNETGSGYEAIVFNGNDVYLTIESTVDDEMAGYLVKGIIDEEMTKITLDANTLVKLPSQTKLHNYADEAILYYNGSIITLYEVNGKNINAHPHANVVNPLSLSRAEIDFPNVEYRITDAAQPDSMGIFWAVNYFYGGDEELKPDFDFEFQKFGIGKTHSQTEHVERLLQFQITDSSIVRTGSAPIQMKHPEGTHGRNWEGIAYIEGVGFIVATDYYPGTVLAVIR